MVTQIGVPSKQIRESRYDSLVRIDSPESLQEADDKTRTQVIETVRAAFDPYVQRAEVRYSAACWMVAARTPSVA